MKDNKMQTTEYPNLQWQKFFNQFNDIDALDPNNWKTVHLIAYFCKRFETHFKSKYSFRFNTTAPSKSYEVFNFNKLSLNISRNPIIVKEYIDWLFDFKLAQNKRKMQTMAYLTDVSVINEFKFKVLMPRQSGPIDRTMKIPANLIELAKPFADITTYGELSFIKKSIDNGNDMDPKYKEMLILLSKNGLSLVDLERVK